jgi:hypothetical protein
MVACPSTMRPPVGSVWAAAGNAPDSVPHSAVVARSVRRAVKVRIPEQVGHLFRNEVGR